MESFAKVFIGALSVALMGLCVVLYSKLEGAEEREAKARRAAAESAQECQREGDSLRDEVVRLKGELAKAIQAPPESASMELDESILALGGKPSRGGSAFPRESVVEVVRGGRGGLQTCYERALKRHSGLRSQQLKLKLDFAVHPSGRVSDISIKPLYDKAMDECMRKAIDKWQFPGFKG
ncbi:MAG: AgmX/PglI C-terminal domain-containing protein, partial [Myxococcota bacterium]